MDKAAFLRSLIPLASDYHANKIILMDALEEAIPIMWSFGGRSKVTRELVRV